MKRVLAPLGIGLGIGLCLGAILGAVYLYSRPTILPAPPSIALQHAPDEPTAESPSTLEPTETTSSVTDVSSLPSLELSSQPTPTSTAPTTTQLVVLAFDGSRSIEMWQQTRDFAKEMAAEGAPVHFTYFINSVYLLAYQHRMFYHPPGHATGTSPIGFASSEKDVADRLEQMNAAEHEGHEIACHLSGHYNGATWTQAEWAQEFKSFFDMIAHVATLNHLEKEPLERRSLELPPEGMSGFRAPDLGVNEHLWPVLTSYPFTYDTSLTDKLGSWPSKRAHGLWEFPLTKIPFAGSATSSLLSMDYNFYFKQSNAVDVAKQGTPLWDAYYQQVLTSYRDYFAHSYQGNHAPLFIGHHFSLWNDGVYWEAMKTFAREVCGKPGVKCVSYKEAMEALSSSK